MRVGGGVWVRVVRVSVMATTAHVVGLVRGVRTGRATRGHSRTMFSGEVLLSRQVVLPLLYAMTARVSLGTVAVCTMRATEVFFQGRQAVG